MLHEDYFDQMPYPLDNEKIRMAEPLPCDLYNSQGKVVFKKGFIIHTEKGWERLLSMQLFTEEPYTSFKTVNCEHSASKTNEQQPHTPTVAEVKTSFNHYFEHLAQMTDSINRCIVSSATNQKERLELLVSNIFNITSHDPETCLAYIHFNHKHPITTIHPLYSAILAHALAQRLNFETDQLYSLVGAALTANLGMFNEFDKMVNSNAKLTSEQLEKLKKHPDLSCELLANNKIEDELWLKIVSQHHERPEGDGYPKQLVASEIIPEATLLAIVDTYLALIMPRAYREPLVPKIALKKLYNSASKYSKEFLSSLIRYIGVYPPGSFVSLNNNEVAIVTKRNIEEPTKPLVTAIYKSGLGVYRNHITRDTRVGEFEIKDGYYSKLFSDMAFHEIWSAQKFDLKVLRS